MSAAAKPVISVVVPVYNEAESLEYLYSALRAVIDKLHGSYEIVFVDDGSRDASASVVRQLRERDRHVRLLRLTRNFGKEIATTAGIHAATGEAIITLDADGQHPVERIPEFIDAWKAGAKVVVGRRTSYRRQGVIKRYGSKLFYALLNRFTGAHLVPDATDFRLIDRSVQQDFKRITERNRITRGLIDWLGYQPTYVPFKVHDRIAGSAGYSLGKLIKLAIDSVVSLSISPLYITAYIGAVVLPGSVLLGLGMLLNVLLHDPLHLHATGGAYLMVFILFLIGILLVSQGIIGLYLSHIHTETQNRPLYVVDTERSEGIAWNS
jgi:glycosyltransferase involved in cell wall biosynthesis